MPVQLSKPIIAKTGKTGTKPNLTKPWQHYCRPKQDKYGLGSAVGSVFDQLSPPACILPPSPVAPSSAFIYSTHN